MPKLELSQLETLASKHGLRLVSAVPSLPLLEELDHLKYWQEQGFAGEMKYMKRPGELLGDPRQLLENGSSILVFAVWYDQSSTGPQPNETGRVARYAWGEDYHTVLKNRLAVLVKAITEVIQEPFEFKIFSDAVPLMERALARRAGIGFIGKNSMLIRPGEGSYFLICEVITNLEIDFKDQAAPRGQCGACTNCMSACPTGAIVSERVIDSRRCISYLTIEKRGMLSSEERKLIGGWVFGCDVCQDVCPFNHSALKSDRAPDIVQFSKKSGVGPFLNIRELLSMQTARDFHKLFSRTAIMRTKREGLLRNACIVASNLKYFSLSDALMNSSIGDPSPVVRSTALWALAQFAKLNEGQSKKSLLKLLDSGLNDPNPIVSNEAKELCNS